MASEAGGCAFARLVCTFSAILLLHLFLKLTPHCFPEFPPSQVALLTSQPSLIYGRHLTHCAAFLLLVYGGPQHEEAVFYTLTAMTAEGGLLAREGGQAS